MRKWVTAIALVLGVALGAALALSRNEPVVGGPCEGCDAVFQGRPDDPGSSARIAPVGERGEALVLAGVVRDARGQPVPGIIVYAYHTDATGVYPPDERFRGRSAYHHGRLRAWVRTDASGRYRFATIRPGGYPDSGEPEHIHLHVIEPGRCTYYIDDVLFDDDARLTARHRQRLEGRGDSGLTSPRKDETGAWRVSRDIILGQNIPGYPPN
ncbi:MAG: hypothetical protein RLZZ129_2014 [Verrucomicrobiota bacterium]|jgi:protocatechuate 3,4-dioxygenase beta subunit